MLGIDLERLFRSPGQISTLRVLWNAPTPLTGRQIQQLAGVHKLTATQSLEALESLGLVQRRAAGRAYLYTLKRSHRLVQHLVDPIFEAEQKAPEQLSRQLDNALKGRCLSATIYGSVARGETDHVGDLDLLVVVENDQAAERFRDGTQPRLERLIREGWSLMLEVNLKTRRQLIKEWASPLIKTVRREGRLVAGLSLEEVKHERRS